MNTAQYKCLSDISCFLAALAEILSVKEVSLRKLYYVHYIDCEYRFFFTSSFFFDI